MPSTEIVNPFDALPPAVPAAPIDGTQPLLVVPAVQYVDWTGSIHATVKSPPPSMVLYLHAPERDGIMHWPSADFPQATWEPSLRRAMLWCSPASMSTYASPLGRVGTLHCP